MVGLTGIGTKKKFILALPYKRECCHCETQLLLLLHLFRVTKQLLQPAIHHHY